MSGQRDNDDGPIAPVVVIENIPARGDHKISADQIRREGIPTPPHLLLYPEFARGGMGHIHAATDRNLLRHVALKRLDASLASAPLHRTGFIAEAQVTGQLEHPNIVPVHELAIAPNGVPYFTMKLVQGITLYAWLRDPARPPGSSSRLELGLETFLKVCDAIGYAHHRGVIHLDIKGENVMVASFGQVYVMDWGVARLTKNRPVTSGRSQMEEPGPVGTPAFMSPEQAHGEPSRMDERTDIFGLGTMLYEIMTGHTPYGTVTDPDRLLHLAQTGKVVPVETVAETIGVSPRLCRIVDRALAFDPADRYQTVADLQADVRAFLRGGLYLPRATFDAGQILIREGDRGDTAYMLVSGTCRAYRDVDGRSQTLSEMGPGAVFGEMALLLDEPRAATVEAVDRVTVLVLDKKTLTDGLGLGGWTGALVQALANRFRNLELHMRGGSASTSPTGV